MTDGYTARTCSGRDGKLTYVVFSPNSAGPHPVVFGMMGTGFGGSQECDAKTGKPLYRTMDPVMKEWADAGFVAVNIGYHGVSNGLYGDLSYPGTDWGAVADGTVQLNVKPAVQYFLDHNPAQYGADPSKGLIAFGSSSGAHNAYMLANTGLRDAHFAAAIGWSGFPDVGAAGDYIKGLFLNYMRTKPGSDTANFGDPMSRIAASSPPQYIANGRGELVAAANASVYWQRCQDLGISMCWLRVPTTAGHANAYEHYVFSGNEPERTIPPAAVGATVIADTIAFAQDAL